MSHDHHGHDHAHNVKDAKKVWLYGALLVLTLFMLIEILAGILANSVALLSDGAHMFSDVLSLGLAIFASVWATKPHRHYTFGRGSLETMSAQINGAALLILAGILFFESIQRLLDPADNVVWLGMVLVGILGAAINLLGLFMLGKSGGEGLNMEGAKMHMLGDLFGSFAAVAAGLFIALFGWYWMDSVASIMVCLWMVKSGWSIVYRANTILLGKSPSGIEPQKVGKSIADIRGVYEVHDLHIWNITQNQPTLSAHVTADYKVDCHMLQLQINRLIAEEYNINHITLQMEHRKQELIFVDNKL